MRAFGFLVMMVLGFLGSTPSAVAQPLKLASWNIANLSAENDTPLRRRATPRSAEEFARLAHYGTQLDADIIALQEMGSPEAIWRVFDENNYDVIFSSRHKGAEDGDIYTALIYRKDRVKLKRAEQLEELALTHQADGRAVRQGVAGLFEFEGEDFWVMSIHLKAGCIVPSSLKPARSEACETYADQVPILENWIDEKHQADEALFVAGDFNRKFDRFGVFDHMWEDIDDGDPEGLDLHRLPYFRASNCPTISKSLAMEPVDFFVFNNAAQDLIIEDSFDELIFSAQDAKKHKKTLSDHCPMSILLKRSTLLDAQ